MAAAAAKIGPSWLTPRRRTWRRSWPDHAYTAYDGVGSPPVGWTGEVAWPRGLLLSLATLDCERCHGVGMTPRICTVCKCVLRAVFHRVFNHYSEIQEQHQAQALLVCRSGQPEIEYMADVEHIARRHLTPGRWHLFREHILRRREWSEVAPEIGLDRGNFYHEVYRVEEILGKAFFETRPYGLFPPGSYFD